MEEFSSTSRDKLTRETLGCALAVAYHDLTIVSTTLDIQIYKRLTVYLYLTELSSRRLRRELRLRRRRGPALAHGGRRYLPRCERWDLEREYIYSAVGTVGAAQRVVLQCCFLLVFFTRLSYRSDNTRIVFHFIIDLIPSYQYLICICKQFDALTCYGNRRIDINFFTLKRHWGSSIGNNCESNVSLVNLNTTTKLMK